MHDIISHPLIDRAGRAACSIEQIGRLAEAKRYVKFNITILHKIILHPVRRYSVRYEEKLPDAPHDYTA